MIMVTAEDIEITNGEQIGILFKELTSIITQRSSGEMLSIMSESCLSMPQMVSLQILAHSGPRSISALAAHLNLSLAATSHLVDRLVQQNLVARSEDLDDRRHKSVAISAAGNAILDRVYQTKVRDINQAVSVLPTELRAELQHALAQIVDALKEAPAPQTGRAAHGCQPRKKTTS